MKKCFKCHVEKPLSDFYKHKQMADGHLNKCKDCARTDVAVNYQNNRVQYAEYEKKRFARPERKEQRLETQRRRRANNPEKYRVHSRVHKAIRSGRLVPQPCEVCKTTIRVQAHHDDYSKPLDVRWLCFQHHREHHGQTVNV